MVFPTVMFPMALLWAPLLLIAPTPATSPPPPSPRHLGPEAARRLVLAAHSEPTQALDPCHLRALQGRSAHRMRALLREHALSPLEPIEAEFFQKLLRQPYLPDTPVKVQTYESRRAWIDDG